MSVAYFTEELGLYDGIVMEIRTLDEEYHFIARVQEFRDETLLLAAIDEFLPDIEPGTHVWIRAFIDAKQMILLNAVVQGWEAMFLSLGEFQILERDNRRETFRQEMDIEAKLEWYIVEGGRRRRKTAECRVLDVSLGGARIKVESDAGIEVKDIIRIEGLKMATKEVYAFHCDVRWKREAGKGHLYGLQFRGMNRQLENQISREIMQIQIQEIQKRRAWMG